MSLPPLRDYQTAAVNHCLDSLSTGRVMVASPTGSGKSLMELALAAELRNRLGAGWIITPRIEIAAGMLEKLGVNIDGFGETRIADACWAHGITTPIPLRNAMLAGRCPAPPWLIFDEAHHHNAESWCQIDLMSGGVPAFGFTASPYRGTPAGTAAFRKVWGSPWWAITWPEAAARGVVAIPQCRTVPIMDDDAVTITNGEFVVSQLNSAFTAGFPAALGIMRPWFAGAKWDRPTVISVPSRQCATMLAGAMLTQGLPCEVVTGETGFAARRHAFAETLSRSVALIQINVVGEGVDLPLRRLLDLSPIMSPVKWLQLLGRITRPSDEPPEYVCTNRNLLRHAYLLEGLIPAGAIKEAQSAFNGPGKRAGVRAIGLEGLGRFKAAELPLADGTTGLMYQLSTLDGNRVTQFAAMVRPNNATPLWAKRENLRDNGQTVAYGRWEVCDTPPTDVAGFASCPPAPLSDKQKAWWARSAAAFGLDPNAEVTRKNFAALPILADLRKAQR